MAPLEPESIDDFLGEIPQEHKLIELWHLYDYTERGVNRGWQLLTHDQWIAFTEKYLDENHPYLGR